MRRRKFITLLGSAAAAWPMAARAQQARMPVLGFLGSAAEADYKTTTAAVRRGLNEAGYVEKQNLLIDYRWADFQYERLPALAAELVKRPVDAIFATRQRGLRARRQGGDGEHPDRVRQRQRPGRIRPGRQPQPTGWQRHRHQLHQ